MNNQRTPALIWVALTAMCVQTMAAWVSQPAREMNQGAAIILALAATVALAINVTTISLLTRQLKRKHDPSELTALVVFPSLLWHGAALLPVSGLGSREYLFWVNVVPDPAINIAYHAVLTATFLIVFVVSLLPRRTEASRQA
jgi:hypothetical protein